MASQMSENAEMCICRARSVTCHQRLQVLRISGLLPFALAANHGSEAALMMPLTMSWMNASDMAQVTCVCVRVFCDSDNDLADTDR